MSIMNRLFTSRRLPNRRAAGFTIIEILIVLSIAGLILVVVLLAVPNAQRNTRNHARKEFVEAVGSQLEQYYADHHAYPSTPAEGAQFVAGYLADIKGYQDAEFWPTGHSHSYVPPLDTTAVQYGHWCNRYGDGDNATDPIAGTDIDLHQFVVWTALEPVPATPTVYCVDNH